MSAWDDAAPQGRPAGFSGDWRGTKPTFDDPMSWAFPVFRVSRITVRVHLFFLAFILAMLARAASVGSDASFGLAPTAIGLAALGSVAAGGPRGDDRYQAQDLCWQNIQAQGRWPRAGW